MAKELIDLYDKYDLGISDRFVAEYMIEYIDSLTVEAQSVVLKAVLSDEIGFRKSLTECINYCNDKLSNEISDEEIMSQSISSHAMFFYCQIKVMEEYLDYPIEKVEGISSVIREYFEEP